MKSFIKYLFLFICSNMYGQEWQNFSMPNDTTIFHKMCHIDNFYWAIDYGNGSVFHSKDGGENWELQFKSEGEYLEAIQFLNKDVGFLCGDYGIVMKTIDGGENWKEIGPKYESRVTKTDSLEGNSKAIGRYYYKMYFKDENNGLTWCFEIPFPPETGFKFKKDYFFRTIDGGSSWEKIEDTRETHDSVIMDFLKDKKWQNESAMEVYFANEKAYKTGRSGIKIWSNNGQNSEIYQLPQFPDKRYMLRTIHFINDQQGYVFGGSLEENSNGYIYETLDAGKSWKSLEHDMAHIHYTLQNDKEILLTGKEGLLKKWTPVEKETKSFIHKGNTSKILIDGQIEKREWVGANKIILKPGVDLYTLQDDHYLYLSVQYDTTQYANYNCDLYFELGDDTLLNIHASRQLGERILTGKDWTDAEPAFNWGDISKWTANKVSYDKKNEAYLPYNALEFQISKERLPKEQLKIALQSRDMNWEKEIINMPEDGDFKTTKNWLTFYWE